MYNSGVPKILESDLQACLFFSHYRDPGSAESSKLPQRKIDSTYQQHYTNYRYSSWCCDNSRKFYGQVAAIGITSFDACYCLIVSTSIKEVTYYISSYKY